MDGWRGDPRGRPQPDHWLELRAHSHPLFWKAQREEKPRRLTVSQARTAQTHRILRQLSAGFWFTYHEIRT